MIKIPKARWGTKVLLLLSMSMGDRFTTTSSRSNIFAPLEIRKFYEVQVRAVNTQDSGDWSDAASILVR